MPASSSRLRLPGLDFTARTSSQFSLWGRSRRWHCSTTWTGNCKRSSLQRLAFGSGTRNTQLIIFNIWLICCLKGSSHLWRLTIGRQSKCLSWSKIKITCNASLLSEHHLGWGKDSLALLIPVKADRVGLSTTNNITLKLVRSFLLQMFLLHLNFEPFVMWDNFPVLVGLSITKVTSFRLRNGNMGAREMKVLICPIVKQIWLLLSIVLAYFKHNSLPLSFCKELHYQLI